MSTWSWPHVNLQITQLCIVGLPAQHGHPRYLLTLQCKKITSWDTSYLSPLDWIASWQMKWSKTPRECQSSNRWGPGGRRSSTKLQENSGVQNFSAQSRVIPTWCLCSLPCLAGQNIPIWLTINAGRTVSMIQTGCLTWNGKERAFCLITCFLCQSAPSGFH